MSRFIDEYPPGPMNSYDWVTAPKTQTQITVTASGSESANKLWKHPRRRFNSPQGIREFDVVQAIMDHWLVMGGPFQTFPLRDPLDFASCALLYPNEAPPIAMTDQVLGVGDGFATSFKLTKAYRRGATSYTRRIYLPVTDSVIVGVGGIAQPSGWSVTRDGGVVTFDAAPADGLQVTAGFLFDCEVRFEDDDSYQSFVRAWRLGGFADISLVEVPPCAAAEG